MAFIQVLRLEIIGSIAGIQMRKRRPDINSGEISLADMSNVLSEEKKQQVIALGKLGWTLRRIEQETGVRRETAAAYLKAAGIAVHPPGWRRRWGSKPAIGVATDPDSKPAIEAAGVATDFIGAFSEKSPIPLPASSRMVQKLERIGNTHVGLSLL
jgi:hypothetical protein